MPFMKTAIESTKLGAIIVIYQNLYTRRLIQQLEKGYEKRLLILEAERLKKEREERLLKLHMKRQIEDNNKFYK